MAGFPVVVSPGVAALVVAFVHSSQLVDPDNSNKVTNNVRKMNTKQSMHNNVDSGLVTYPCWQTLRGR